MGFFSSSKTPSSADQFNKQEAFLAVALATSAADGKVDPSEVKAIFSYLLRMKMFEQYSEKEMSKIFEKLVKILQNEGPGGLVAIVNTSLPVELRETAFACAVDIALADGVVEDSEKALIEELQQVLEISEETAQAILQVMLIKNRN